MGNTDGNGFELFIIVVAVLVLIRFTIPQEVVESTIMYIEGTLKELIYGYDH